MWHPVPVFYSTTEKRLLFLLILTGRGGLPNYRQEATRTDKKRQEGKYTDKKGNIPTRNKNIPTRRKK